MNLILFFWFYFVFFSLCEHRLYDSFVLKQWNDVVTSRCFCLLKRFFILRLGLRIFFLFNSLIVSIVFPHGPISGWCQIGVWDKSNQIIHNNLYYQKMIYTKIHVIFLTWICFINWKIMFLLNLSMIIMKFVQLLFFNKFTIKFMNSFCQILLNMNNEQNKFCF